jgi:hypothetical protein
MKCDDALDTVYQDGLPSLKERFALALHILFCPRCAARLRDYEQARILMQQNFFPPSPDFTEALMKHIFEEEDSAGEVFAIPGGVSTRGWIIVGFIVLISLSTLFFGGEFTRLVLGWGSSFLLPLGITIGMIITGYGALFIGSHLKELSERFNLKV